MKHRFFLLLAALTLVPLWGRGQCNEYSYVSNLQVVNYQGSSALVQWGAAPGAASYEVALYASPGQTLLALFTTTATRQPLTRLDLGDYTVTVTPICPGGQRGYTSTDSFSKGCLMGGDVVLGTNQYGAMQNNGQPIPFNPAGEKSASQQLFLAAELAGHTDYLDGISLYVRNSATATRHLIIYADMTTRASYQSWEYMDHQTRNKVVFEGDVLFSGPGWTRIDFDTPFHYTGNNLMLSFKDSNDTYTSFLDMASFGPTTGDELTKRADGNFSFTQSYFGSGHYGFPQRNYITFHWRCYNNGCTAPVVLVDSVGGNAVSLSWLPGNGETQWRVDYKQASATNWTTVRAYTSDTMLTISNLQGNTSYDFRVRAICGQNLAGNPVRVRTACTPITAVPFTEDFDNFRLARHKDSFDIEPCWHRVDTLLRNSSQAAHAPYLSNGEVVFPQFNSDAYLALPLISVPLSQLELRCELSGLEPSMVVGVMSDPTDGSTFTAVDSFCRADGVQQRLARFSLAAYQGGQGHIAVKRRSEYDWRTTFSIDNLVVDYPEACPSVSLVRLDTATALTARVSFRALGQASQYSVRWGHSDYLRYAQDSLHTADTTALLTGLQPWLGYNVWVRTLCPGGGGSEWRRMHFYAAAAPDCPAPALAVQTTDEGEAEAAWTGAAPLFELQLFRHRDGTLLRHDTLSANSLTLSPLDPLHGYLLRVRQLCDGYYPSEWDSALFAFPCPAPELEAEALSTDSARLRWPATSPLYEYAYRLGNEADWSPSAFTADTLAPLSGLAPGMPYVARLRQYCDSLRPSEWAYATFSTPGLPCPAPTGLSASVQGPREAMLTWSPGGSEEEWAVLLWSDETSDTLFTAAPHRLCSGLRPATTYRASVRSLCGLGYQPGQWSDTLTFATPDEEPESIHSPLTTHHSPLKIHPNPTTGELRVESSELRVDHIDLYDMTGRLVLSQPTLNSQLSILHLNALPDGAYLLRAGDQVRLVIKKQ